MGGKTSNHQLQAVWFAAGVAVVIACVERAVVVSVFRQWHMWVFLALNLLLIAILFTSRHPPQKCSNPPPKSHTDQESDQRQPPTEANEINVISIREEGENGNYEDGGGERLLKLLSNEELNERVEAFISRFRQQYLVSDVKISRSYSDNVCGRAVLLKTVTV